MANEIQQVEEVRHPVQATPMPTLGMIFTVLATLTWASTVGVIPPEGALGIGVISLAVFPSYAIAAAKLLKNGDGFNGNIFSIFCCFFSGVAGVSNIMGWASATYGIPFPGEITGVIWTMVGLELAMCLVPIWKGGWWSVFIQVTMATIGLLIWGLSGVHLLPADAGMISGWLFFFVGLEQLYFTGLEHVNTFGCNWSYGPLTPPAAKAAAQAAKADK